MDFKAKRVFIMYTILLLLFSSVALLNGDEKDYTPLLGSWDIEADAGTQAFSFVFQFKMVDGVLKGKMIFEMGEGEMKDVSFDGKKLTFSISLDINGQPLDVVADAEVDGQKMSGTMTADMGAATFIGEKQKKE